MRENKPVSVLADRYASAAMREIFAPESKIIAERKLWIAVARAQTQLGHAIPESVIKDYEKVVSKGRATSKKKAEEKASKRAFFAFQTQMTKRT